MPAEEILLCCPAFCHYASFFISFLTVWTFLYSSCSRNLASETLEAAAGWWRWSNKPELGLDKANKLGTASQREGCYQLHREGKLLVDIIYLVSCHPSLLLNIRSSPTWAKGKWRENIVRNAEKKIRKNKNEGKNFSFRSSLNLKRFSSNLWWSWQISPRAGDWEIRP